MNGYCLRRVGQIALLTALVWVAGNRSAQAQTTLLATAEGGALVPAAVWKKGAGWLSNRSAFKKPGQPLVFYGPTGGVLGRATLGKWQQGEGEEPDSASMTGSTLPASQKNKDLLVLGGDATMWQTGLPPVNAAGATAAEKNMVAQFLQKKGLPRTVSVNVTQVFHVDLDRDGQTETVIAATAPEKDVNGKTRNGYSVVLLLARQNGSVRTIPVKTQVIRSGSEDERERFRLLGFPDLYHTQKREIVVDTGYYEGSGLSVFRWKNNKLTHDLGGESTAQSGD